MKQSMPNTLAADLTASEMRQLKDFGGRTGKLGVNFAVCDQKGQLVLICEGNTFNSDLVKMEEAGHACLRQIIKGKSKQVHSTVSSHGRYITAVLVPANSDDNHGGLAAVIDPGIPQADGQQTMELLSELLRLFVETFIAQRKNTEQTDMISSELAQTYEELVLLYKITSHMELVEPDANFLQMACDSLTEIVSVEGIAILQEKIGGEQRNLGLVAAPG